MPPSHYQQTEEEPMTCRDLIDRVALAIHRATCEREPTEPLREKGGVLDPRGATYKAAVAAVREMTHQVPSQSCSRLVVWNISPEEARAVHHALATTVSLIEQVEAEPGNSIPPEAPLYGWHDRLIELARRLDHEINQTDITRFSRNVDKAVGHNPLGGASRGTGGCVCAAGPGTNPACEVHP